MDHDFERIANFEFPRIDCEREFAEGQNPFGFSADIDEQLVLVFRDDKAA